MPCVLPADSRRCQAKQGNEGVPQNMRWNHEYSLCLPTGRMWCPMSELVEYHAQVGEVPKLGVAVKDDRMHGSKWSSVCVAGTRVLASGGCSGSYAGGEAWPEPDQFRGI